MPHPRQFLLIDHLAGGRRQLAQALVQRFPGATVHEFRDAQQAVALAATEKLDAIVVHRSWDMDARSLVRILKAIDPAVPIIATSGVDRAQETLAAGATHFLPAADWARLGAVVAQALDNVSRSSAGGQSASPGSPAA